MVIQVGLVNEKVSNCSEEMLMKCTAFTYYASTNSSQPGWFHAETYMCVLGLWFANTGATKITMKQVGW